MGRLHGVGGHWVAWCCLSPEGVGDMGYGGCAACLSLMVNQTSGYAARRPLTLAANPPHPAQKRGGGGEGGRRSRGRSFGAYVWESAGWQVKWFRNISFGSKRSVGYLFRNLTPSSPGPPEGSNTGRPRVHRGSAQSRCPGRSFSAVEGSGRAKGRPSNVPQSPRLAVGCATPSAASSHRWSATCRMGPLSRRRPLDSPKHPPQHPLPFSARTGFLHLYLVGPKFSLQLTIKGVKV